MPLGEPRTLFMRLEKPVRFRKENPVLEPSSEYRLEAPVSSATVVGAESIRTMGGVWLAGEFDASRGSGLVLKECNTCGRTGPWEAGSSSWGTGGAGLDGLSIVLESIRSSDPWSERVGESRYDV